MGKNTSLWDDKWISHAPLKDTAFSSMTYEHRKWTVAKIIVDGQWDIQKIPYMCGRYSKLLPAYGSV